MITDSALIGLGSNAITAETFLETALDNLAAEGHTEVIAKSAVCTTPAVGGPTAQPHYRNAVALLKTALTPHDLLQALLDVEQKLGRTRNERWGSRCIDLDLLLYDDKIIELPSLVVPHPRLNWRHFVLAPACEIVPQLRHPFYDVTLRELLERFEVCRKKGATAKQGELVLAFAGKAQPEEKDLLAKKAAEAMPNATVTVWHPGEFPDLLVLLARTCDASELQDIAHQVTCPVILLLQNASFDAIAEEMATAIVHLTISHPSPF